MMLLVEGAVLAVLVVWLFLRDWRATLVSRHGAAAVHHARPSAAMHYVFGFTLNTVTLLAMSLSWWGILVDDAIVEIENIMRHLRMGKTPYQAAMEAADEIGLAVIATTFTLIAVFLPTAFMAGVPGKFFVQFGWTAAIAVFFLAGGGAHAHAHDGGLHPEAAEDTSTREPFWMNAPTSAGRAGA